MPRQKRADFFEEIERIEQVLTRRSYPRPCQKATVLPQLWVSIKKPSMPSVFMFPPLSSLLIEIRAQRGSHDGRQRLLSLDGVMFDLPNQLGRQVHVELLDVVHHDSMLGY
jgi:hypothetical protein